MRDMIIGWVLATFHTCYYPAIYNLIASEVEAVFEANNITNRKDKIAWLSGDKLKDMVREYHNKNIWAAFTI